MSVFEQDGLRSSGGLVYNSKPEFLYLPAHWRSAEFLEQVAWCLLSVSLSLFHSLTLSILSLFFFYRATWTS